MKRTIGTLFISALAVSTTASADTFVPGKGGFTLNGEPFLVKAAELHYPRIPRPYWEHRIEMAKALGMNTICMYVFWNLHEPERDEFDFTGQNDIAEFVRIADRHGMKVIVRPGPYVCAEWEMGGLPWWLLREEDIELRKLDPRFMERVKKFEHEVAKQLAPYTVDKGGPVIMVQVENEYGSYGTDKEYVGAIRDMLRKEWGDGPVLFQCDWSSNFENNGLEDLVWTMNFGTGADVESQFSRLRELRPESPLMCSEYWSGWFDKWGAGHETRGAEEMVSGIEEFLEKGISFSLYMTHGGTSFGHWAGANSPGFAPDVTSYDYDAPINEWGAATEKYHLLRGAMSRHSPTPLPEIPAAPAPIITIPEIEFTEFAPLEAGVTRTVESNRPQPIEPLGMGWGTAIYRTTLPEIPEESTLSITEAHDYAQVFVDGARIGCVDRVKGESALTLPPTKEGSQLDIVVEAMGRINFGTAIKDRKGITERVTLTEGDGRNHELQGWSISLIPDDYGTALKGLSDSVTGSVGEAGYYRGRFELPSAGDTFIDMSTWGKGQAYVNGHAIGRFWNIGPQQTLYVPGCWLREGENEIVVLDVEGPTRAATRGLSEPIIDRLGQPLSSDASAAPDLSAIAIAGRATFKREGGWQSVRFPEAKKGKHLVVEIVSTHDADGYGAIAEIHALGPDGKRLSREEWKAAYASTDNRENGNHTLDKTFDLQESTFWETGRERTEGEPVGVLVVDMGSEQSVAGIELLGRAEKGAPGATRDATFYVY